MTRRMTSIAATNSLKYLPNSTTVTTWLLIASFTIVILNMVSAPHVEYSVVVQCGVFAFVNNYPMDGLAKINNSMGLSRRLNYKQTQQTMPIWNGFHSIVFVIGGDILV